MKNEPFTTREFDDVAMFDVMRHGREEFAATDGRETQPAQPMSKFRALGRSLPRRWGRDAFERAEKIVKRVLRSSPIAFELFHVDREVVHGGFAVMIVRAMNMSVSVRMLSAVTHLLRWATEMKGAMRHDLRTALFVDLHGATEMVRMRMGDEDGVDIFGREPGLFQPMTDRIPGRRSR